MTYQCIQTAHAARYSAHNDPTSAAISNFAGMTPSCASVASPRQLASANAGLSFAECSARTAPTQDGRGFRQSAPAVLFQVRP